MLGSLKYSMDGMVALVYALMPVWPDDWVHFAGRDDLVFAASGLLLGVLLLIWWRQQSDRWYWIAVGTFLLAASFDAASYFLFRVPPHQAGCPDGCIGWVGYPLPFATLDADGSLQLFPLDLVLNLLLLWLLWLGATVLWRLLAEAISLDERSLRFKIAFFLVFGLLPWAFLPRYFNPPQTDPRGEELRLAVNARRAAESTYKITGLWVQRLALEDIRFATVDNRADNTDILAGTDERRAQVCLRGYTYFYIPWRRYRITLDHTGVTALNLTTLSLDGSCWQ